MLIKISIITMTRQAGYDINYKNNS